MGTEGRPSPGLDIGEITFAGRGSGEAESEAIDAALGRLREARKLRATAAKVWPEEAVSRCGCHVTGTCEAEGHRVAVLVAQEGRSARWGGVTSCHSVWLCPVCAARIAAKRREQVHALVREHQERGGVVVMLTLTQSHGRQDNLKDVVSALTGRWSKLRRRRSVQQIEAELGIRGGIRSLEITHSVSHGWHPHLHLLVFLGGDGRVYDYGHLTTALDRLIGCWLDACDREGVKAARAAQDWLLADDATAAGDYVAKWGVAAEMTHGHVKRGRGQSRTPWDILRDYGDSKFPFDYMLLSEYGKTMKGRRQLTTWGDVSMSEVDLDTDDKEAVDGDEEAGEVSLLAIPDWEFDRLRRLGALEAVERAAIIGGFEAAYTALRFLGCNSIIPPELVQYRFGRGRPKKIEKS